MPRGSRDKTRPQRPLEPPQIDGRRRWLVRVCTATGPINVNNDDRYEQNTTVKQSVPFKVAARGRVVIQSPPKRKRDLVPPRGRQCRNLTRELPNLLRKYACSSRDLFFNAFPPWTLSTDRSSRELRASEFGLHDQCCDGLRLQTCGVSEVLQSKISYEPVSTVPLGPCFRSEEIHVIHSAFILALHRGAQYLKWSVSTMIPDTHNVSTQTNISRSADRNGH